MKQNCLLHTAIIVIFSFISNLPLFAQDKSFSQYKSFIYDDNVDIKKSFGIQGQSVSHNVFIPNIPASIDENGKWNSDFSVPGIIGTVFSATSDNNSLYLGGNFKAAGSIIANSIVQWDGKKWHTIGEGNENGVSFMGSNETSSILSIAKTDDKVFIAGQFDKAGTVDVNGIAYWDGNKWCQLGNDLLNGVTSEIIFGEDTIHHPGNVYSLLVHDNLLYVGGYFNQAGKYPANGFAIWNINNRSWEFMDNQLCIGSTPAYIYSISSNNKGVYLAGKFEKCGSNSENNIAFWNGESWNYLGRFDSVITDIEFDKDGRLFAAGFYQQSDNPSLQCGLGMFDGKAWHSISGPEGYRSRINNLYYVNNQLFVSGYFEKSDGTNASLAKWDGNEWLIIDKLGYANKYDKPPLIKGIASVKGKLYVAGNFTKADDEFVANISEWDDRTNTWKSLNDGTGNQGIYDGSVFTVEKNGTYIYAGGSFSVAGGKFAHNIARYNGYEWESLGKGEENGISGSVFTILSADQNVFAGGYFGKAGLSEAYHVAQWNGNYWQSLGIGVGGIMGAHVRDMALMGDYLYVAGYFSSVGNENNYEIPANSIARFNLVTRKWDAPQKGVENGGVPGIIYDIELFGNKLILVGQFNEAGGKKAHNFAILDGTRFTDPEPMAHLNGTVRAVEIVNGQILIGGHLIKDNSDYVYGMLKWTANGWEQICSDEKLEADEGLFVTDIESFRDGFIAGGHFNQAGTKILNNLAYFNGKEWMDIGGGIQNDVSDFVLIDNQLFLAGSDVISSGSSSGIGLTEFVFSEVTDAQELWPELSLLSNFPNPFRNKTEIFYHVNQLSHVELTVFDISGKRIKSLVNEQKAAGQYTVSFHSEDLDPGIYMCRISYANSTQTHKLIISE